LLDVKELVAWYEHILGYIRVLNGVSLVVNQGEIVTLIGPNGAGKTTLLRAISGLIDHMQGKIYFQGRDVSELSSSEIVLMGIGHAPQGRHVFATLSVRENLLLGAYLRRKGRGARAEIESDLEWICELFPILGERQQQKAGTLSGGEQQMLSIGRALMARPKFLLLDEPSLGLAPHIVQGILATLRKLNEEGLTILMAEQGVQDALFISHRGYVLQKGRIIMEDTPARLSRDEKAKSVFM